MDAGNPGNESVPSRPLCSTTDSCPVEGFLKDYLGNGGCIFCQRGECAASPLTVSLFSKTAAAAVAGNTLTP